MPPPRPRSIGSCSRPSPIRSARNSWRRRRTSGRRSAAKTVGRHHMEANWAHIGPALTAAFLASVVEAVEALTIVLAVATVRGWRPAGLGASAGLASLALIVAALGPLLEFVPLHLLQLAIGILLLLFGLR